MEIEKETLALRLKRIFDSCKTREQHETAIRWARLALRRAKLRDDLALDERLYGIIFNASFRRY